MRLHEQSKNANHNELRLESYADDAKYSVFAVKSIDKMGYAQIPQQ
jgi:hypothetical protein